MMVFKNKKQMKPFYNKEKNEYRFIKNGEWLDVKFEFPVILESDIFAGDILAKEIKAYTINARDISAKDICAYDISARDIDAENINAIGLYARDIDANTIISTIIEANEINYLRACVAVGGFICKSCYGEEVSNGHICIRREIVYKKEEELPQSVKDILNKAKKGGVK